MNDALQRFHSNDEVASIHGYLYPIKQALPEAFFLPGADCWGWATWRRGWSYFNADGQYLLDELNKRNLIKDFDYNGTYPYSTMLQSQIDGRNDSWAIRWYASTYLLGKITLYPGCSLVHNIGNDGSGTHSDISGVMDVSLRQTQTDLANIPVAANLKARQAIEDFFRAQQGSWLDKSTARLKELIKKAIR